MHIMIMRGMYLASGLDWERVESKLKHSLFKENMHGH